ncbi:CLUMA_CG006847, isoform A [Clunio marinus]|uniref:CLUMA_CG006847, isoform A n=1 Tax=Clunio marinus TaxID=568069 RepID=A0A1J1HYX2_9DIPT|nr:CLUMA_CG006847, isoform A [Clunio marinus]
MKVSDSFLFHLAGCRLMHCLQVSMRVGKIIADKTSLKSEKHLRCCIRKTKSTFFTVISSNSTELFVQAENVTYKEPAGIEDNNENIDSRQLSLRRAKAMAKFKEKS